MFLASHEFLFVIIALNLTVRSENVVAVGASKQHNLLLFFVKLCNKNKNFSLKISIFLEMY